MASGNIIGENRITKILDDKVIYENWTDVRGFTGKSFTLYDSIQHCWKQTWVDNSGGLTEFTGVLKNDTMTFISNPKMNKNGETEINKMIVIKISENELQQTGSVSLNGALSWQTLYSFKYKRQSKYTLTNNNFTMKLHAVKIKVNDLEKAKKFYVETLGFNIDISFKADNQIQLYTNAYKIILELDKKMEVNTDKSLSSVSICMAVKDIDSTFKVLKSKNVKFFSDEKRKEGVGYSMKIFDPFGNSISMMQLTYPGAPKINEPYIFNGGYFVSSIEKARKFYSGILGFVERTKDYLPDDMPLGYTDNAFAFMLHQNRPEFNHKTTPNMKIVFAVSDLNALKELLNKNKISFKQTANVLTFTDNNGIQSEVVEKN
jgi:catechol 2,3-dioxygenase-like lactoylglutathione lyase family enzyme